MVERRPPGGDTEPSDKEGFMQQSLMRLVAAGFYVALGLWVVMTIATILSPSSGTAKAAGVFGIVAVAGFFAVLTGLILARYEAIRGTGGKPEHPSGDYRA